MNTRPSFQTSEAELYARMHTTHELTIKKGALDSYYQRQAQTFAYPWSFLQEKFSNVRVWREEALAVFEKAMRRPRSVVIDAVHLKNQSTQKSWMHEEWTIQTSHGLTIPATVLVPLNENKKHPAVLLFHDMSGMRVFGREKFFCIPHEPDYLWEARYISYEGVPLAEALADSGYLVLSIDALGFGERVADWDLPYDDFLSERMAFTYAQARKATFQIVEKEYAAVRGAFLANTTWAGLTVQDDILTLDFLCARDDVDRERIGCMGLSFGAYRTNYLAALDQRIKSAVSVCWHSTLNGIAGYNMEGAMGAFTLLPGLHDQMDLCDIPALACPRSFLAISAWEDRLMQPFGAVQAHLHLRKVWEKAGASSQLGSLFFEGGHRFGRDMQQMAFKWLETKLRNPHACEARKFKETALEVF